MYERRKPLIGVTATLAVAASCGDRPAQEPEIAIRDSAGIAIVENPSPDDSLSLPWWRLEGPEVDIGGFEAEEPYALFQVRDALRREDGSIVVANGGSSEVRFFEAQGRHIRSSGGEGEGPGEYQALYGLERGRSDSLLAVDSRARRVSVLDAEGRYVRSLTVQTAAVARGVVGILADGALLTASALPPPPDIAGPPPEGLSRSELHVVRVSADGTNLDTLATHPGSEQVIRTSTAGGNMMISLFRPAFGKRPTVALHDDRLYVGGQDAPEIRVYETGGSLRRILRTGRAPEAVTEEHLEAMEERRIERLPPERRADARANPVYTGTLPHGELVPPYGTLMTDLAGNLWVSDHDDPTDPPGRWTVYDPDGRVRARVVLPERFTPFDIGEDWILGRELDELDVEHVRLYRIVRT